MDKTTMYSKTRMSPREASDGPGSTVERYSKTIRFTVDGVDIEVPSVEYVRRLERIVEEQGRTLRALGVASRNNRNAIRAQHKTIRGVQSDLDGKLDYPT